jgi:hypothetical protein
MGFRFRKSFKILPGVRINVGKRGVSTTIGGRGASINVGKKGTYINTSIPGTGLSYRQKISSGNQTQADLNATNGNSLNIRAITACAILLFIIVGSMLFVQKQANNRRVEQIKADTREIEKSLLPDNRENTQVNMKALIGTTEWQKTRTPKNFNSSPNLSNSASLRNYSSPRNDTYSSPDYSSDYDSSSYSGSGGTVHVRGYYRKDGTYVRPHTRRRSR